MTLSEWIQDNQDTVNIWARSVKENVGEPYWKIEDFCNKVIGSWWSTLQRQAQEGDHQITAQDVDSVEQPIGSVDPIVKRMVYDGTQYVMQKRGIGFDSSFLNGIIDNDSTPSNQVANYVETSPQAAPFLGKLLQSVGKYEDTPYLLNKLIKNPAIKQNQVVEALHSLTNIPNAVGGYSRTFYAIKNRLGDSVFDAEMDKLPITHPLYYSLSGLNFSKRSGQEIQDYIDSYKERTKPENIGNFLTQLDKNKPPEMSRAIFRNPNLTVDHLWSLPENYFKTHAPHGEFEFEPLNGKVPPEELEGLFKHMGLHTQSSYGVPVQSFVNMMDMSGNNGRPPEKYEHFESFPEYSKNPTFVAQPRDIVAMDSYANQHGLYLPEKMSPELQNYFQNLTSLYDKASKGASEEELRRDWDKLGVRDITGLSFYNIGEHLSKMLPVMSNLHPEYMAQVLDKATPEYIKQVKKHLKYADKMNERINPNVFNEMTNAGNLFEFFNGLGVSPSKLKPESARLLTEGFKQILPSLKQEFVHFPDKNWEYTTDDIDDAAQYGALDEYFNHVGASVKHRTLQVKRGSGTLRALRDYLEQAKERGVYSVNPRDLPKDKTWNSVYQSLVTKNKDGSTTESKTIDWNPLRGKDGNVSAETVQSYIDRMQPIKLHVTETKWDGAQRHNDKHSNVVVFGLSDDHVAKLKAAGVWDDYKKVSKELPTGHPQHPYALGWVRYTTGDATKKSHVFIDEVQNDVAKTLGKTSDITDANKKKIMEILYDGSHPSDMLHEAFHEYARSKKWHGRPFTIHSPESKKPISLARQDQPVPVHYKKTYEEILKQRFHVEPSTYGERKGETHSEIQGKPVWTGTIRKMEEELEKMALADVQGVPRKGYTDYSHLLPEHLMGTYKIRVHYYPSTPEYDNKPRIIAYAIDKNRDFAGSVSGFISGGQIETHQGIKPKHQRQGLGTALLESVLAHARNTHGVTSVKAAEHTEGATGTHRKVSAKHDLGFESSPTKADKYGQWYEHGGYMLKSEGYSDWE